MPQLADVLVFAAAPGEPPEMQRTHLVLAASGTWLTQIRDALASPTYTGLAAAMAGGWQSIISAMPEQALAILIGGTLAAVADTILGVRRARREGRAELKTFLVKVGDKVASRFGCFSAAVWIGMVKGNPWTAVSAVGLVLGAFEVLSLLGHAKALRADSEVEGAFIDKLASTIAIDKLIDLFGSAGEWLRSAKSASVPEKVAVTVRAAPNGGA